MLAEYGGSEPLVVGPGCALGGSYPFASAEWAITDNASPRDGGAFETPQLLATAPDLAGTELDFSAAALGLGLTDLSGSPSSGGDEPDAGFTVGERVYCAYPNCGKHYASQDGVRKHAKRYHLDWLHGLDVEKRRCGTPTPSRRGTDDSAADPSVPKRRRISSGGFGEPSASAAAAAHEPLSRQLALQLQLQRACALQAQLHAHLQAQGASSLGLLSPLALPPALALGGAHLPPLMLPAASTPADSFAPAADGGESAESAATAAYAFDWRQGALALALHSGGADACGGLPPALLSHLPSAFGLGARQPFWGQLGSAAADASSSALVAAYANAFAAAAAGSVAHAFAPAAAFGTPPASGAAAAASAAVSAAGVTPLLARSTSAIIAVPFVDGELEQLFDDALMADGACAEPAADAAHAVADALSPAAGERVASPVCSSSTPPLSRAPSALPPAASCDADVQADGTAPAFVQSLRLDLGLNVTLKLNSQSRGKGEHAAPFAPTRFGGAPRAWPLALDEDDDEDKDMDEDACAAARPSGRLIIRRAVRGLSLRAASPSSPPPEHVLTLELDLLCARGASEARCATDELEAEALELAVAEAEQAATGGLELSLDDVDDVDDDGDDGDNGENDDCGLSSLYGCNAYADADAAAADAMVFGNEQR
jgi:hypothetical protein